MRFFLPFLVLLVGVQREREKWKILQRCTYKIISCHSPRTLHHYNHHSPPPPPHGIFSSLLFIHIYHTTVLYTMHTTTALYSLKLLYWRCNSCFVVFFNSKILNLFLNPVGMTLSSTECFVYRISGPKQTAPRLWNSLVASGKKRGNYYFRRTFELQNPLK